ncbi:MAG: efflux RND transporter permease subunit [Acidobacteria bacterium]|nr:efflux RND transporter permease subunit [Acidobacteriota bacterium]MBS1867085.1 efflux RND transporter permease subunit [Acidobacteriota bacterium]
MWLLRAALRSPISVVVLVIGVALCSILALARMPVDIFPNLNLPVIYVAQPYGGMSPAQMEGYLVYYYEYHFLYITGIESVESKSIQNVGLLKLTFHPGTDMSQAAAQTVGYVDRARAFMPPGTVSPFIMRFDAGSVPVGYLVFSSSTKSVGEIQDLALNRVRPLFATLPGVSAPPPFGGNQRTIVVSVDPDRLRAYRMAPEEVVQALSTGNTIVPAGNVRTGDLLRLAPINSVVSNIKELQNLPIRAGAGPTVFLRDVGTIEDSSDIVTGYAEVNGRRTVYIPVTKRADASTLAVVNEVKASLAQFQSVVPPDIKIDYEFDQSSYVRNSLLSVVKEGLLGAVLTGVMVLFFLRDWRSGLIVVATIPFALLAAVVALWGAGQTVNIMTLGGLALAVGILVDESTVVMENIHNHLGQGRGRAVAVLEASKEVQIPRLLAMLCILAVFVPSFFMTGVSRSLFVPLSLAVGFAMAASYFLSSTLVPVLSTWILHEHPPEREDTPSLLHRVRDRLGRILNRLMAIRGLTVSAYVVVSIAVLVLLGPYLGREIFPRVSSGQLLLRFRAPIGTRVETTERLSLDVLRSIQETAGPANVAMSLGYVGAVPPSYPINAIYLWTSGQHEAVLRVALNPDSHIRVDELEERLRKALPNKFPGCQFSFEAGDIVTQIMNFGAPTPVEVNVSGPDLGVDRAFAAKLRAEVAKIPALRDLQYDEPLDYPSIDINVDRERAGQLGVTTAGVGQSFLAATSSSRFVAPNYWADPKSGVAYQVQVQIPQSGMTSVQDVEHIPVTQGAASHPLIGDVAQVGYGTVVGEYHRLNGQRMVTLTANVSGEDLGRISSQLDSAIRRAGELPRGVKVAVRGQIGPMKETLTNLGIGLLLAVLVIYLLLAANFQSLRLAFIVLSTVPAVICGVVFMLLLTGTSLNIQSFMGAIMAIGVAVANAILLVTFAEEHRRAGTAATESALYGAKTRLRPILMTSLAMIAGMVPMALGIGEGSQQTAPLGRAVIGGLLFATAATLVILPLVFSLVQQRVGIRSPSLDPDDPASAFARGTSALPGETT